MEKKRQPIKRIMLIDDDPITNMISSKIITRDFDFSVPEYTNAQVALDHLIQWINSDPEQIPDIILLDINMPQMDGWEFLDRFQQLPVFVLEKCRVIMLSSSLDREDIERSKKYECVQEFLSKPLTSEKVKNLVMHAEKTAQPDPISMPFDIKST